MFLENVGNLNKSSCLDAQVFDELFLIDSEFERELKHQEILAKAEELGCKTAFETIYKARKNEEKAKAKLVVMEDESNVTCFSMLDTQLNCGYWHCDNSGVWIMSEKSEKAYASYHPIIPLRILRNAETGQYKTELLFEVRGQRRTALVDRSALASSTKILSLADQSVQVTSLNAPLLVKYLADVEALNPFEITEVSSTSRLGWIDDMTESGERTKKFLPYDSEVVFDNELNTKSLFDSIAQVGSRDKWFETILEIRAKKQIEVLINLAASFASVLVEPCGALPFIVSLWGGTGIGKTVVLMLATSIWADPSEGQYMTDAKATSTAMEIRLNILNSLPMTLDDMAQIKNQYDEDFSQLIYRWCAGRGRDRSNVNLGLNKLTSWRNCTITNGERSLVDESTQGGAVNRVIDIESSGEVLFSGENGSRVANILRGNYGFAGREFIELIEKIGFKAAQELMDKYYKVIKDEAASQGNEKEDKQIIPMALILTADELAEKYLFKDGIRLDVPRCVGFLKNKGEVSEHKRAYEYLKGYIASNDYRFLENVDATQENHSIDGFYAEHDRVAIIGSVFDQIMKQGGFQSRAFLSWAKGERLIDVDSRGQCKKGMRLGGKIIRCVVLLLKDDADQEFIDSSGFENPFE